MAILGNTNKKHGFTLAEVLITLGIIGVVAALTIPTLISNYRKHIVETRLAKFYTTMNQAIILSEVYNGDRKTWAGTSINSEAEYNWFMTYFAKYIQILKIEQGSKFLINGIFVYFPDGSGAFLRACDLYFFPHANNMQKKDSILKLGKDYFLFGFYPSLCSNYVKDVYCNKGYEIYLPYTWNGTLDDIKKNYPARLIEMNNWKIPDDYPIKF